jgi:hypothetical protein
MRKTFAYLCLLQMIFLGVAWGQANRASVTGTIIDTSGAPVAGVEVTAKSLGTNVAVSVVTNADGLYSIPNLFPGDYSLEFKKDGFKPVEYPSITLESTQVAQMNAALQLGPVS